jgi:hypothetical protein
LVSHFGCELKVRVGKGARQLSDEFFFGAACVDPSLAAKVTIETAGALW